MSRECRSAWDLVGALQHVDSSKALCQDRPLSPTHVMSMPGRRASTPDDIIAPGTKPDSRRHWIQPPSPRSQEPRRSSRTQVHPRSTELNSHRANPADPRALRTASPESQRFPRTWLGPRRLTSRGGARGWTRASCPSRSSSSGRRRSRSRAFFGLPGVRSHSGRSCR